VRRLAEVPVWLGHVGDARDWSKLHDAGIEAVVALAWGEPTVILPRSMVSLRFPIIDGGGNPAWLLRSSVEAVANLIRAEVPTLICCGAGVSRTPAIAAAALAWVREISLDDALARITQSGPTDVSPWLWAEIQAALRPTRTQSPAVEGKDEVFTSKDRLV